MFSVHFVGKILRYIKERQCSFSSWLSKLLLGLWQGTNLMAKETSQFMVAKKEGGREDGGREWRSGRDVCLEIRYFFPSLTPSNPLAPSRALVAYSGMRLGPLDAISSQWLYLSFWLFFPLWCYKNSVYLGKRQFSSHVIHAWLWWSKAFPEVVTWVLCLN